MRSGGGGEGSRKEYRTGEESGGSRSSGFKRCPAVRAKARQRSRNFRARANARQNDTAMRGRAPPALFLISWTSSRGVSQKSRDAKTGPETYQPSHNRTTILRTCPFIARQRYHTIRSVLKLFRPIIPWLFVPHGVATMQASEIL